MLWHWPTSVDPIYQATTNTAVNSLDFAESGAYFVTGSAHDVSFWYIQPPNTASTPTLPDEESSPRTAATASGSAAAPATPSPVLGGRVTVERHAAKLLEGHDKRTFIAVCCGRSPPPPAAPAPTGPSSAGAGGASAASATPASAAAAENTSHLVYALTDSGILAMFEQKLEPAGSAAAGVGGSLTPNPRTSVAAVGNTLSSTGGSGSSASSGGSGTPTPIPWRIIKWLDAKLETGFSLSAAPHFLALAV